eukprot:gene7294-8684_t
MARYHAIAWGMGVLSAFLLWYTLPDPTESCNLAVDTDYSSLLHNYATTLPIFGVYICVYITMLVMILVSYNYLQGGISRTFAIRLRIIVLN